MLGAFGDLLDAMHVPMPQSRTTTGFSQTQSTASSDGSTGSSSASSTNSSSTSSTGSGNGLTSILDLIEKLLGKTPSSTTGEAASTDGTTPSTDAGTPPTLLKNALDALKKLSDAEASGQPVDADTLKQAKDAIDALQAYLATQQPAAVQASATTDPTATADATTGAVSGVGTATGDANPNNGTQLGDAQAAQLETARASLHVLAGKLEQMSSATTKLDPDLANKLDSLAKSLDPTKLTADTLNQLGLTGSGTSSDPKLASAINALANGAAKSDQVKLTLGTPQLKVPDGSALSSQGSGKATGLAANSATGPSTAATDAALKPAAVTAGKDGDSSNANSQDKAAADALAKATVATNSAPDGAAKPADASAAAAAAAASAATAATSAPADTRSAQAAYPVTGAASSANLSQMAYEIVRNAQQGTNHFQIKLDPADLGRVDVKLAIDATGTVNAHLTVERSETLDLLRRDQSQLGQALSQAGLDSSKTNLQFSLSQNPFTRQDNGSSGNGGSYASAADDQSTPSIEATQAAAVYSGTASSSGLNLFV